ncbi:MAG: hypothetical protein KH828_01650 [Clostridiales bacterium]|nr:hypothetical protein [Clostridiales bacterium]
MKKLTKKQHRAEIRKMVEGNDSVKSLRCIQSVAHTLKNVENEHVLYAVSELTDLLTASQDNEFYKNLTNADWYKVSIINSLLNTEDERYLSYIKCFMAGLSR